MSSEEQTPNRTAASHEPKDSAFKQQALPAWQPILTAGTVLPTFFVIGVAFIPIGVGLMYFSNQVHEVNLDYTECISSNAADAGKACHEVISELVNGAPKTCQCIKNLEGSADLGADKWIGNVFIYYGLTNFYQNHRRYVKSRDDKQLYGDLDSKVEDCSPFLYLDTNDKTSERYAPCGAIANSMFNDTIQLQYKNKEATAGTPGHDWTDVSLLRTGIAWQSDKEYKFRNPEVPEGSTLQKVFQDKNLIKPRDWGREIWELDTDDANNNGFQNEDLIVWMRTAALPNFRKLYRRIDHQGEFETGLPVDGYEYRLFIDYSYKVTQFSGTKSVILSTTSLLGGKNPFLGIAYIVVGCICFIMGIVFLFIHLKFGRTTREMMNITSRTNYNGN